MAATTPPPSVTRGQRKTASDSGGGDTGKHGEGLPGLRTSTEISNAVQIHGADTDDLK